MEDDVVHDEEFGVTNAVGNDGGEPEIIYVETIDDFLSVVKEKDPSRFDAVQKALSQRAFIHENIIGNEEAEIEYVEMMRAKAQFDRCLSEGLQGIQGLEAVEKIKDYEKHTNIGTALLFDGGNYQSDYRVVVGTYPNLGWYPFRFNDRTTSIWNISASTFFYTNFWYKGFWIYAIGVMGFEDLYHWPLNRNDPNDRRHFANRISSYWTIP